MCDIIIIVVIIISYAIVGATVETRGSFLVSCIEADGLKSKLESSIPIAEISQVYDAVYLPGIAYAYGHTNIFFKCSMFRKNVFFFFLLMIDLFLVGNYM